MSGGFGTTAGTSTSPSSSIQDERETGTVKRFTKEKGYGFIRRASGGADLFVHIRSLKEGTSDLEEGQTVEFDVTPTEKGEEARNVSVRADI